MSGLNMGPTAGFILVVLTIGLLYLYNQASKDTSVDDSFQRIGFNPYMWNEINACIAATLEKTHLQELTFSGLLPNQLSGTTLYDNLFPCIYICVGSENRYKADVEVLSMKIRRIIQKYLKSFNRLSLVYPTVKEVNGIDYLFFIYAETDIEKKQLVNICRPSNVQIPKHIEPIRK